jgi:hypothetical protein
MPLRTNFLPTGSTTLNTLVAGSTVTGNTLTTGDNARQKLRNLSALADITIVTGSLTVTGKWQVSLDGSTWRDVAHGSQNAAGVAITATGLRVFDAPAAVYGWPKVRFSLVTAGATGAAGDLYNISYFVRMGA